MEPSHYLVVQQYSLDCKRPAIVYHVFYCVSMQGAYFLIRVIYNEHYYSRDCTIVSHAVQL